MNIYKADVIVEKRANQKSPELRKVFKDYPVVGNTERESLDLLRSGATFLIAVSLFISKGYEYRAIKFKELIGMTQW